MLTRRQFSMAAALAAGARPDIVIVAGGGGGRRERAQWAGLRNRAVWLLRGYAANPGLAPYHATLQTGRFSHELGVTGEGVTLRPDSPTIAARLSAAGYQTIYAGDWRLGGKPAQAGYSRVVSPGEAASGLRASAAGPRFLFVNLDTAPDTEWLAWLDATRSARTGITVCCGVPGSGVPGWREPDCAVPIAIRWPGRIAEGTRQDWLCSSVDLAPILAAAAQAEPLTDTGAGRLALLTGNGAGRRPESLYSQGRLGEEGEWRMLVRGWDKLVISRDRTVTHLYNLAQDPGEENNLAIDRATVRRQEELQALLRVWILQTGDRIPYSQSAPFEERRQR